MGSRFHPKYLKLAGGALIALLASVFLSSCGGDEGEAIRSDYNLHVVEKSTIQIAVNEVGVVESTRVANIVAPLRSRIISIVEDGTMVNAGDVVAVLDQTSLIDDLKQEVEELASIRKDLESQVESLMIDLRSNALDASAAMAQLDLARVQLADVNRKLGELEYLQSANIVASDQVRDAESDLRRTEISTFREDMQLRGLVTGNQTTRQAGEVDLERIDLRAQKSLNDIREAKADIEQARITAPVAGLFTKHKRWNWQLRRMADRQVGEEVREGDKLGEIPDMESLIVRSQIPESEVRRVSPGSEVRLQFEALGNLVAAGRVATVAPIAIERETSAGGQIMATGENLTGEMVFEVTIEILEKDPRMRPGLTVRTRVIIEEHEEALTVPLQAVRTENGRHFVQVLSGSSLEMKEVGLGLANEETVEVTTGLSGGETVLAGRKSRSATSS